MKATILLCITAAAMMASCGPSQKELELKKRLEIELIDLKSKLAAAETRLEDTKQFHLLRTADEKATQIEFQTREVLELKKMVKETEIKLLDF